MSSSLVKLGDLNLWPTLVLKVFILFLSQVTYPNMIDFFEQAGVEMEESDMSFSVSLNGGKGCEWGSTSLGGLFAQKRNMINPFFFQMIREIVRFKDDVLRYMPLHSFCPFLRTFLRDCSPVDSFSGLKNYHFLLSELHICTVGRTVHYSSAEIVNHYLCFYILTF